ncbi:polysaccharide deacetylase family protein [Fodinicola feengrottensis]|uniref:Polysaccharide deacetylase family protein n=1 Tax=Fodinicola feengrottensis TaxID=435914 RepID=A0ABN2FSJ8_9ACTN
MPEPEVARPGDRDRTERISRRTLLRAGATVPLLLSAAACGATPPASTPPPPSKSAAPPEPTPSPTPTTFPVQQKAIYTLAEYAARTPGAQPFAAKAIALTLDDGPHAVWTPKMLRLLKQLDIHATFFMIGVQAKGHPDLIKAIHDGGHALGNHTYNHLETLPHLSVPNIRQQIVATQDAVFKACGAYPRVFRAPGGNWGPPVFAEVAAAGMMPIHWQTDTNDWTRPGTSSIERRVAGAPVGSIVLCHDGGGDRSETIAALTQAVPALKARGYQFVTLA